MDHSRPLLKLGPINCVNLHWEIAPEGSHCTVDFVSDKMPTALFGSEHVGRWRVMIEVDIVGAGVLVADATVHEARISWVGPHSYSATIEGIPSVGSRG